MVRKTAVLKSKDELETTRELLDETEELLQFGSWTWELGTNSVTWTSGLYTLLEYDAADGADTVSLDFYLAHVLDEYRSSFRDIIRQATERREDFTYEYVVRTK